MLRLAIAAQVVISVLTFATTALAQVSCENSILISALEMRLSGVKARHKGCKVGEEYRLQEFLLKGKTGANACVGVTVAYEKCWDTAQNVCQVKEALATARTDCSRLKSEELELAKDAVDELNDRRPEDGGANTLSKELTRDALDRAAATGKTNLGNLDRISGQMDNAFSDTNGSFSTGGSSAQQGSFGSQSESSGSSTGLNLELSPEFQAILDGSGEALRQAKQENNLSIEEAQRILNSGLRQIDEQTRRDVDRARDEISDNQTESAEVSELEARMQRQFDEFRPSKNPTNRHGVSARQGLMFNSKPTCYVAKSLHGKLSHTRSHLAYVSDQLWRHCTMTRALFPWEVLCGASSAARSCLAGEF